MSRSPRGERGLKYRRQLWRGRVYGSRSPRGERGLKSVPSPDPEPVPGRSPRGERGLKCSGAGCREEMREVAPLAGSVD